ncbi:serine hydrolase [Aquimarina celericrescens]|uniref:Serine hydrolase n=1 Tax=Aquimarina celericrescens TaxID=1964542 RepID=A0ABW5B3R5_9FLAO|nr:serine hydrolase [Aquimarina celericrescens]
MKKLLGFLLLISLVISCKDRSNTVIKTPDKTKMVETGLIPVVYIEGDSTWTIEERMKHYGVPGVSIAVINNNKIEWVKTYGVIDKETKEPVNKQTLFQAGSISKPVAAYGALKLVEQNKIDIDKDVNTYLESWKIPDSEFTKEKKVALKHLMSHSGGVTVHGFLGYSQDLPVPSLIEVLNGTPPANSPPIIVDKVPEESSRYSGGGYTIMQQMMIDIEKKPFPELMEELILKPLQMNNSTYDQPLKDEQLAMAATGYLPNGDMTKGKRHTYPEMAAAGLWTTAEDLAKFAVDIQQSLQGKGAVLSKNMVTKMLTPFVDDYVGLGIFINQKKDEIYFGHGGWDEGFSSELIAHKEKGYGVVVLTNSNHPKFISELIRSVALAYQWDDFVATYPRQNTEITELEELEGEYRLYKDRYTKIYNKGNQLFKESLGEEAVELIKITDSTFVGRDNDQIIQFKDISETGQMSVLVLNPDSYKVEATLAQIMDDEKLPIQFLESGNFNEGLKAYQELQKTDPKDPAIQEWNLNRLGYQMMNVENLKLAQDIFKVNTILYPRSANVYDSYAEASMKLGELNVAMTNYKKSIKLDPKNMNATKMIEEMQRKKENKAL